MAIKASFSPSASLLSVFGDNLDNTITTSRDAAGQILINGGAVSIDGGQPTVANTAEIEVSGQDGDDMIALDEANGALPAAELFGGRGNDVLTGGSGADQLFGQAGNDTISGKGGNDSLFGGSGNDVLTGGTGSDQFFGQAGNDTMIWNPGEGSDLFEGGDGTDTAEVEGGNGAEVFTITANGGRVRFDRTSPAPFTLDIGTTENLVLNANDGNDMITAGNGLAGLIQLTLDGGAGNDTITGGDGNDVLIGGDGNDSINGGHGHDVASLGAGDDVFVWNQGDGSDVVDGQDGFDTLLFNGASGSENIGISAKHGRVTLTRDVGAITMDLNGIEHIQLNPLTGADTIAVGDLTGTNVTLVAIDLAATPGSAQGDGQPDTVTLNGTAGDDQINVVASGSGVAVTGLAEQVTVDGMDAADQLTINGGAGNDTITGGNGNDMLIGGSGNDVINGGHGNDIAFLGSGNDTFIWNPGDASDVVEGQGGIDTLTFNGSNLNENIDISANGARVRLTRDLGNVTMDLNSVEHIHVAALGGADLITVNDLTGTGTKQVAIDLAAMPGTTTGDNQPDTVIVNDTAGNDHVSVVSSGASVIVNGLSAQVTINGAEPGNDSLTINGLGGNDTINASALKASQINLVIDGGAGDDRITGSQGNDLIRGGAGSDAASLGAGDDVFVWNPGDGSDTVDGQAGADTLTFIGSNLDEKFDISANGKRVSLVRDLGNVTMDVNNTETIDLRALGGADTITVNDLSGTDVSKVKIDLAAAGGDGDGQVDTIVINATNGDDAITVTNNNGMVTVSGLATEVTISNFEANDRIVINGLGGDDVISASGLGTAMLFTANGGDGDDVLIGSDGNDSLNGDAGDDVLIGGLGQDALDGGPGGNILIQSAVNNVASDGSHAASLALLGQFMASSFVTAGDGNDGTSIFVPPSSQQPLLTPPHV
jgi:Ca2+-binding RTX toxin-like protein